MNLTLLFAAVTILSRAAVSLPAYESVKGMHRYATAEEYGVAARDQRYRLEKIAYTSDELTVYAYLYAPAKLRGRYPTVIYNRGSWVRDEFAAELLLTFRRLAGAGYIVIAPMLRGSGGAEGRDEMGGADLNDLMNIRAVVAELPFADADNLFLYGESRGGMMTLQAARDGFPMRAAVVFGTFTDLESMPATKKYASQIWPEFAEKSAEIIERRSALRWAEKINTPLLIVHGAKDGDVDPRQVLAFASRLQELEKEYALIIRAGEGHVLAGWRIERDAAAVDWFKRHRKE